MVKPIPCPSCNGLGCSQCNYIGFFGQDERGQQYYLAKDNSGNVYVSGPKSTGGGSSILGKMMGAIFAGISKSLAEPHDFIWETKQKK